MSNAPADTNHANPEQPPSSSAAAPGVAPGDSQPNIGGPAANDGEPVPVSAEARMPTKKDTSLKEFLSKMDDHAPIIPDAVTHYYMTKAGLPPPPHTDPRLARLIALAVQKFVADIAADAYQYSRIRASNSSAANNPMGNLGAAAGIPIPGQAGGVPGLGMPAGGGGGSKDTNKGGAPLGIQRAGYGGGGQGGSQNRTVLTMEDLGMAVGEYGVNVKRSEFYR